MMVMKLEIQAYNSVARERTALRKLKLITIINKIFCGTGKM